MKPLWVVLQEWLVDSPEYWNLKPKDILAKMKEIEDAEEISPPVESTENPADILEQIIWRLSEQINQHEHAWDIIGVYVPPSSKPIHPRLIGTEQITIVLLRCQECNWPQTIELDGIWTAEQVQGSKQPASDGR